jgi:hypothetical protein
LSTPKFSFKAFALLIVALGVCPHRALAGQSIFAPGVNSTITGTDVSGKKALDVNVTNSFTISEQATVANGGSLPSLIKVMGGFDGTNVQVLKTDVSGNLQTGRTWSLLNTTDSVASVQSGAWSVAQSGTWNLNNISGTVSLPTGAATSANQTTANTSLSSIDTKLSSQATATKQDTGNTSLASIDTKLSSQATAANQTTANTSLSSIDTKLSSQATAANQATANSYLSLINTQVAKTPINVTGSQATTSTSTVVTITAPANAVGFILQASPSNTDNLRWRVGATATTTVGMLLAPGQDSGYVPLGANISLIPVSGTQEYEVQWVAQ